MSESNATKTLRTHLQTAGAHCQRFEDKLTPGIPDTGVGLHGVYSFLEGKFIKALPARDSTLVRFGSAGEPRLAHQCNWLTAEIGQGISVIASESFSLECPFSEALRMAFDTKLVVSLRSQ